jgi:hypothetical protein
MDVSILHASFLPCDRDPGLALRLIPVIGRPPADNTTIERQLRVPGLGVPGLHRGRVEGSGEAQKIG